MVYSLNICKWLFNYLVNHVFELFKNLKTMKIRNAKSFGVTT